MNKDIYFVQQSLLMHSFFQHDLFTETDWQSQDMILLSFIEVDKNFVLSVNE